MKFIDPQGTASGLWVYKFNRLHSHSVCVWPLCTLSGVLFLLVLVVVTLHVDHSNVL